MKIYTCRVDWDTELPHGQDARVYTSLKAFKKHRTCWKECGIVAVEVGEPKILLKGELYTRVEKYRRRALAEKTQAVEREKRETEKSGTQVRAEFSKVVNHQRTIRCEIAAGERELPNLTQLGVSRADFWSKKPKARKSGKKSKKSRR